MPTTMADLPKGEARRLLSWLPVLEPLPEGELDALVRRSAFERLDHGESFVVSPEEHRERMLVLVTGRVQVYDRSFWVRAARPRARGLRGSRAVAGVPGRLPRPRRALLEGMDSPRALQSRPRALQHSRGPGTRGARPPRLQFCRNRLREAAPRGVPPGPAHLGRRGRGGTACRRRRPGGGLRSGTLRQPRLARISPRPVTSDSRPVSPCSEPPTKEET